MLWMCPPIDNLFVYLPCVQTGRPVTGGKVSALARWGGSRWQTPADCVGHMAPTQLPTHCVSFIAVRVESNEYDWIGFMGEIKARKPLYVGDNSKNGVYFENWIKNFATTIEELTEKIQPNNRIGNQALFLWWKISMKTFTYPYLDC